jgi:glycine C-acetyltransferase
VVHRYGVGERGRAVRSKAVKTYLAAEDRNLRQAGLWRREPIMATPPGPLARIGEREFINLASCDYLGLCTDPELKRAALEAIETWGVGLAATRMTAGSLPLHGALERALAEFLAVEDALVFPSPYHATAGLFEALLSERDFVFCDEQTSAGLADGIRLSRASVLSYRSGDMEHLEDRLKRSRAARFRVIVTDGMFPVLGDMARLREIHGLAEKYDAVVVVDDTHTVGVLGKRGRGTYEELELDGRVDVLTGGFALLGGGAGGYVAAAKGVIDWLRQKSRPYLSEFALGPADAACALEAVKIVRERPGLRDELDERVRFLRGGLAARGLGLVEGNHPAIAAVIGDVVAAQRMTDALYRMGIYVIGFCHPVVPEGSARIRVQVTTRHTQDQLETIIAGFAQAAREIGLPRRW